MFKWQKLFDFKYALSNNLKNVLPALNLFESIIDYFNYCLFSNKFIYTECLKLDGFTGYTKNCFKFVIGFHDRSFHSCFRF